MQRGVCVIHRLCFCDLNFVLLQQLARYILALDFARSNILARPDNSKAVNDQSIKKRLGLKFCTTRLHERSYTSLCIGGEVRGILFQLQGRNLRRLAKALTGPCRGLHEHDRLQLVYRKSYTPKYCPDHVGTLHL